MRFGMMDGMSDGGERDGDRARGRRGVLSRGWLWLVAALVLVWLLACPSALGRFAAERLLLGRLNDPESGLSCREARVEFGYWELLRHLRVSRLELRGLKVDLAPRLKGSATNLFESLAARLDLSVTAVPGSDGQMKVEGTGRVLDWPLAVDGRVAAAYSTNLVTATGRLAASLGASPDGSGPWVEASFAGSPGDWSADVRVPEFRFSESDGVLGRIVSRLPLPGVSNLVFSGGASARATVRRTKAVPVSAWESELSVRGVAASADAASGPVSVAGLSLSAEAEGIADRVFLRPLFLRAGSLAGAGLAVTNAYATLRRERTYFLVSEAGADFCGGEMRLYSLYLDPERLNAGFTLLLDDLDAGEVLRCVPCFRGEASGRLHGKLPLALRRGERLRFGDAFLYSTPGETGTLRLENAAPVTENLAAGGVPPTTCENLARALENLDYRVLRLRFAREGEDGAAMSVKVEGSATRGEVTVPVDFEVTFHGAIEQLVNFGLGAATRNQQKRTKERR